MMDQMEGEKLELKSNVDTNNVGDVIFASGKLPDEDKEIHVDASDDYCGLKKEDLLKYAKDPYWVRLRIILLVIFCITWISMLVAAIIIIVLTPRCPPKPDQEWWETAVVYQVEVSAFSDGNGDRIGDLKGLINKLSYIKDVVGADAIDLSPVYKNDGQPDVNYTLVSPSFGTIDEFVKLVAAARKKSCLKIILDFNFEKNNEELMTNGKDLIRKIDDIILHWLKLKVDGIKIINDYNFTLEQMAHWKQLIENFTNQETQTATKQSKLLMEMSHDRSPNDFSQLKSWNNFISANDVLLKLDSTCEARCVSDLIHSWLNVIGPQSKLSNWMLGNSMVNRITTRLKDTSTNEKGSKMLNAVNLLLLTLPGSVFTYYGDEIGMENPVGTSLTSSKVLPMQWDDTSPMRLYSNQTNNLTESNVEYQSAHGSGMSHLKVFKKYVTLRGEPSLKWGAFHASVSKNIYFFVRKAEGHANILVAINFGTTPSAIKFRSGDMSEIIPKQKARVLSSTYNFEGKRIDSFADGVEINLDEAILLYRYEGIVLKWEDPKSTWF